MPSLPESLENRFNLYLNVLPVVDAIGQLVCFVAGLCLLILAVAKASMRFSKSIQSNHKISKKYPSIHKYLSTDVKVYEMTEKRKNQKDGLLDKGQTDEKKYMLEEEPALSEDYEIDSDTKSMSCEEDDTDGSLKLVSTLFLLAFVKSHTKLSI